MSESRVETARRLAQAWADAEQESVRVYNALIEEGVEATKREKQERQKMEGKVYDWQFMIIERDKAFKAVVK